MTSCLAYTLVVQVSELAAAEVEVELALALASVSASEPVLAAWVLMLEKEMKALV